MVNRELTNRSLLRILEGSERKLSQAINLSNELSSLFNNLSHLANTEGDILRSNIHNPLLDWLQSFLPQLRDNTLHYRNIRNTVIGWVRSRNILPERYRTLEQ